MTTQLQNFSSETIYVQDVLFIALQNFSSEYSLTQ